MEEFLSLGTPALWALAVGFFSPPIISTIQQSRWSARTQSLVAFAFYLAVAAATAWFLGLFNTADIARLALLIFLAAGTSYKTLWKPTGVSPAIEAVTSPKSDYVPKHAVQAPTVNLTINATGDPKEVAERVMKRPQDWRV